MGKIPHTPVFCSSFFPKSLYALCSILSLDTYILLVVMMVISVLCSTVFAASEESNTIVYSYWGKKGSFNRKTGVSVLEGDARVRRSDGDYLNADKITIYRDVETNELIKIEAVGNVDMKEKGMKATCERAIFYETEERIEMEGSEDSPAIVDEGENRMEASKITYFRKEDLIVAEDNVTGQLTIEAKESETAVEEEAEE